MQCFFTSWKCHSSKNLNCQVHQDMKLNAGLYKNINIYIYISDTFEQIDIIPLHFPSNHHQSFQSIYNQNYKCMILGVLKPIYMLK